MKAPTNFGHPQLSLGLFILSWVSCCIFFSCSINEEYATPVLTSYDLPPEVLDNIFTGDMPQEIINVDNFLDKLVTNGMPIHEGANPPEIFTFSGSNRIGKKYHIEHDCIYDEKAPANVDSVYGKYEETILITNQQNSYVANVSYSSVGDANYPEYPSGLDRGSGTGFVSGNGSNFTIFFKVENGNGFFDNIPYQALWIISGTVSDPGNAREISNVTKCLVMLGKGPDPEDKVANRGAIRIFKDANLAWIQPEVVISDFMPTEGPYSTIVTINGSGFSTIPGENVVRFNNITARILEASSGQLLVEVPKGAGTGRVTVQVIDKAGTGDEFTYIPVYTVSTLAGMDIPGFRDGSGGSAQFNHPYGIAVDNKGIIYVADLGNQLIRRITPAGEVSTLATSEKLGSPNGIAVDAGGNIFVTDRSNNFIWEIEPSGAVVSVEQFNFPSGIAVDNRGNIYVADIIESLITMIPSSGEYRILGSNTRFMNPEGIAVDAQGNVYVADTGNNLIRRITPSDVVSTLGEAASFNSPSGVAVDAAGNAYVADRANHQIQRISPEGVVSTLAGTGQAGFLDGIGSAASFNNPSGVAIDAQGIIYVADSTNHRIRKMVLE